MFVDINSINKGKDINSKINLHNKKLLISKTMVNGEQKQVYQKFSTIDPKDIDRHFQAKK